MRKLLVPTLLGIGGVLLSLIVLLDTPAADAPAQPYSPKIAPASNEATLALKRIRVPSGLKVSLFAAEPLLANPVCFCVDEKNRFYVAETFRHHDGVTDIRGHMSWLDEDLASRSVADRGALLRKRLGKNIKNYTVHHERIRLLEDTEGKGVANKATVFADGFNRVEEGIGAGLLARGGNVWYTCIPDFWLLRDTKGTGKADFRKSLHHGYGVHIGYLGHDLHGLRFGPDGKIYFSSGDRGLNVKTAEGIVASPDTGAVLRCNPDGSELELVATGLRNPQELAFDKHGNLFTVDNNADRGDKARLVYLVEGGDSGWRIGYQFLNSPTGLGPWNAEKMWYPPWDGQAAFLVPPIANVADGPSGLTYHPGIAQLPKRYDDHFFLADFRGGAGQSGVRSFAVKPQGASFEMIDQHEFVWSVLATDVDFGMDGALYVLDWVNGWEKTGKGRLYKVHDPDKAKDPQVVQVKKLMAEGFAERKTAQLLEFLEHPDMRVRQEAQFALAARGFDMIAPLGKVARQSKHQLARLHAMWGLGQLQRKYKEAAQPLLALVEDADAEVRAQAAKLLGLAKSRPVAEKLVALLKDAEPRVRFFAALALAKTGAAADVKAILEMLRDNADKDPYLRHAGVMALVGINDQKSLEEASRDTSVAVRLAVLLTWRRLENPALARFLDDSEPRLVLEAARAINDVPISTALPQLAALLPRSGLSAPLLYRVLNANFRLGQAEQAKAVATFAGRSGAAEALRVEALKLLDQWARPSGRDRIVGLWRPLEPRSVQLAVEALRPALGGIFSGPDKVRQEGARLAAKLGIKEIGPALLEMVVDKKRPAQVRIETLKALATLKDKRLSEAMEAALKDADPKLRTEGLRIQAKLQPDKALAALKAVLESGSVSERQGAFTILGEMPGPAVDTLLSKALDQLLAGKTPPEVQLELLEAAGRRSAQAIKDKLARYEGAKPKNDLLAKYRESLAGGDAEEGRKLFFYKSEVSCLRCHKVKGEGGEVGPDLTGIGSRQKRDYLLESIVNPNKEIAKGFETVVLTLTNGKIVTGIVKSEDAKEVRLITAEGQLVAVPKKQIDERLAGRSAMPDDLMRFLSRSELRDLVEFLASLK
jgi:quinoprotein glucose dehydrogenase